MLASTVLAGGAVLVPGVAVALPASGIDLCAEVGRNAGWDVASGELTTAVAIAMAESSCNPGAVNTANRNGSTDRGLWQINSVHTWVSPQCAMDAQCNANAAYKISSGGASWRPWTVYRTARYQAFLQSAREAVARLGTVPAAPAPSAPAPTEAAPTAPALVDGQFVRYDSALYRLAGGAPIHVRDASLVGATDVVADLTPAQWSTLRAQPVDGTLLTAGGATYKVVAGAPIKQASAAAGVAVDPEAIQRAGQAGPWAHLARPQAGRITQVSLHSSAAPRAVPALRYRSTARGASAVSWAAPARATSYRIRISWPNTTTRWRAWRTVKSPTATFSGLTARATYRVQVIAVGPGGRSPVATLRLRQSR